jgi:hypothetical protein
MLVRVLHDEARALGVRVQLLAISRPARTEENRECACDGWPTALAIGDQALALIDQNEPRQATSAVVPFLSEASRTPAPEALSELPLPAEPALLAGLASASAAANAGNEPQDHPYLDQAWSLLEPLFSSKRNEAKKS